MEEQHTIVVVGGGYGGLHLLKQLRNVFRKRINKGIKIILVDQNEYHFKKVQLYKAIVEESDEKLKVPFKLYCKSDIQFVQGQLLSLQPTQIEVRDKTGHIQKLHYDQLVLALGSTINKVADECGGVSLHNVHAGKKIRKELLELLKSENGKIRVVIAGGGITGIEAAAEVSEWLKAEAIKAGRHPDDVEVILVNGKGRLINELPKSISEQLEKKLAEIGVATIHGKKAAKHINRRLYFNDGSWIAGNYCIWTVGVKPSPRLQNLHLPLQQNGKIKTDSWYRVDQTQCVYAIGDCAHNVDASCGLAAETTCKEAISQAQQLSRILRADMECIDVEPHKNYPNLHCIGLGPSNGFVWGHKWGINLVLSGRIAFKIREYTWNIASLSE